MDTPSPEIQDFALALEKALGVPDRFLLALPSESDWSFVVKTHALAECSVMQAIDTSLGNAAVADVISSLALNDARSGKLGFLRALDQGEKAFVRFVDQLSRLRNMLTHNLRHASFDLQKHVAGLGEAHFREFVDAFASTAEFPRSVRSSVRTRQEQLIRSNSKECMFRLACYWLARMHLGVQHALFKNIEASIERIEHGRSAAGS